MQASGTGSLETPVTGNNYLLLAVPTSEAPSRHPLAPKNKGINPAFDAASLAFNLYYNLCC